MNRVVLLLCAVVVAHSEPESTNMECTDCAMAAALSPSQIAEIKMEVFRIVNQERESHGIAPLCLNKELGKAAQDHSDDQQKCQKMSHTGCNGSSMGQRMRKAGYSFSFAGENVAWNQQTAQSVMRAWMNSPGHRRNILKSSFTNIGIGLSSKYYWTQKFGRPMMSDGGCNGGSVEPTPLPPIEPPVKDTCTWNLKKADTFCAGSWTTHRKNLGEHMAWSKCVALVDADAECSDYAYGADVSATGSCRCVRKGQFCFERPSKSGNNVYRRECPTPPPTGDPCSRAKSAKEMELKGLTDEIAMLEAQIADVHERW